jgi:phosphate-selective porin OprO/OprP
MRLAIGVLLATGLAAPAWAEDAETARLRELAAKEKQQEQMDLPSRVSTLEKKLQNTTSSDLRIFWKDGPKMETADKQYKFEIGGRVYEDIVWIGESKPVRAKYGNQEDGAELRTARIALSAELFESAFFKFEYDFAPAAGAAKDIYMGVKNIPVIGTIQVGHFKEPFDLEELTSSRFITFMERNLCNLAFTPSRNFGVMATDSILDNHMTWAVGWFKDVDDKMNGLTDGERYAVTGRLTGLPWYERGGKELVHLGVGASTRSPADDTVAFSMRPETHIDSKLLDTGNITASNVYLLSPELAAVYGPFSLQAQYYMASATSHSKGSPDFNGYYVYASFFVTGESRNYKTSTGAFDRVRPNENLFGKEGGFGAIELAVRYSSIDLNDGPATSAGVTGGKESNIAGGVNWHLNPNMRVMLNYVYADVKDQGTAKFDGKENAFMLRFQFDW